MQMLKIIRDKLRPCRHPSSPLPGNPYDGHTL